MNDIERNLSGDPVKMGAPHRIIADQGQSGVQNRQMVHHFSLLKATLLQSNAHDNSRCLTLQTRSFNRKTN